MLIRLPTSLAHVAEASVAVEATTLLEAAMAAMVVVEVVVEVTVRSIISI